jgi:hypothetical protein
MVQRRRGPCLATKTFERLRVPRHFIREKLKRDEAAQLGAFGFVNHAHAAPAKLFNNAVVRNGLADHSRDECFSGRFILRTQRRHVDE